MSDPPSEPEPSAVFPDGPGVPRSRPCERFWPYADLPETPTPEELAALDPDLHAALFGAPPRPFSFTLVFPPFDGPEYARAVELARASAEYRQTGSGAQVRHRARFYPQQAAASAMGDAQARRSDREASRPDAHPELCGSLPVHDIAGTPRRVI